MAKNTYIKQERRLAARPRSERLRSAGVSSGYGEASGSLLSLSVSIRAHAADSRIHVTDAERTSWDLVSSLFDIDADGNVYVTGDRGFYTNSFVSARGSDPEAGSGAGGLDVDELWSVLGASGTEKINASHIPALDISAITGLQDALDSKLEGVTKGMVEAVLTGTVTSHNHDGRYAPLSDGLIPSQYLPGFVDDVLEYPSAASFPDAGESGKIYVALDTNLTYRWGGSGYVEISPSLALGHTSSTAYPGDEGAANAAAIQALQGRFTGGAANKVAHSLTIVHDGGSTSASDKTFDGSAAVTVSIPTTLPASDVYAWAKASTKPSYMWSEIGGKPSVFAPAAHTHVKADITDFPTSWAWSAITGRPSTLAGYGITDGVNEATASGHLSASVSGHKLSIGVALGYAIPSGTQISLWNKIAALFDIDADGNVYVTGDRGFYTNSFVSARGSDPESGGGAGQGIDEDAMWDALAAGTSEQINVTHIPALNISKITGLQSALDGKLNNGSTTYDTAYARNLKINGITYGIWAPANPAALGPFYIPTSAGTSGYILQSTGGVPGWISRAALTQQLFSGGKGCVAIPENSDLNDYTTPGLYYCPANATVKTLANCPVTGAFSLEILQAAGVIQILREYGYSSNANEYTRRYYNGSWTTWVRAPRMDELYTKTEADGRYLKLAGGTMTGALEIDYAANRVALAIEGPASGAYIAIRGSSAGDVAVGSSGTYGAFLQGGTGNFINIKSAGDPLYNNTYPLLHSANYTSYAVSLTGAQTISGAKTFTSQLTAVEGVLADSLCFRDACKAKCSSSGWYRCFTFTRNNAHCPTAILHVSRTYNTANGESYVFAISLGYNGKVSITQLSGTAGERIITKIRVAYVNSSTLYVDFYYSKTWSSGNEVSVASAGDCKAQTPTPVNDTTSSFYEFETADGCKSDIGFTGTLSGNAATATNATNLAGVTGTKYLYHLRRNGYNIDTGSTSNPRVLEINNPEGTPPTPNAWLQVLVWGSADSDYGTQLANQYNTEGSLYFRNKVAGTWKPWRTLIDNSNYTNYTLNRDAIVSTIGVSGTDLVGWTYNGVARSRVTQAQLRTMLGLGSNAYTSTAYLPLTGGTLTGQLNGRGAHFNSQNGETPFVISRGGDKKESVSISVNDTVTRFDVVNDETSANLLFSLSATDTEAGGGAAAKTGYVNDILASDTIYTRYGYGASQRFRIGWNPNDGAYIENFTAGKWLSITDTGSLLYNSDKIWHSGNDGSGSGLDADLLDGKHLDDVGKWIFSPGQTNPSNRLPDAADLNDYIHTKAGWWTTKDNTTYGNAPYTNFGMLVATLNGSYPGQLLLPYNSDAYNLQYRAKRYSSGWSAWKKLAYTTDNVASATKLATARTLWGKPFDGTGHVAGDMAGVGWINNGLLVSTFGSNSDGSDTTRLLTYGHNVEFGGPGYSHKNYFLRPEYGSQGSTRASLYIQNAPASDSPEFTTTHAFLPDGSATHSGALSVGSSITSGGHLFLKASYARLIFNAAGSGFMMSMESGNFQLMSHNTASYVARLVEVDMSGNVGIKRTPASDYALSVAGAGYFSGLLTASAGITTPQYVQVGDARLRWDAANNALYVEKSDGTACGLYSTGFLSSHDADPGAGTAAGTDTGAAVPQYDLVRPRRLASQTCYEGSVTDTTVSPNRVLTVSDQPPMLRFRGGKPGDGWSVEVYVRTSGGKNSKYRRVLTAPISECTADSSWKNTVYESVVLPWSLMRIFFEKFDPTAGRFHSTPYVGATVGAAWANLVANSRKGSGVTSFTSIEKKLWYSPGGNGGSIRSQASCLYAYAYFGVRLANDTLGVHGDMKTFTISLRKATSSNLGDNDLSFTMRTD